MATKTISQLEMTLAAPVMWDIDQIDPSRYQQRLEEDPAHVAEVAESIREQGLKQYPRARANGTRAELIFGHTRLAAFKLLVSQGYGEYQQMPLYLDDVDDLHLFEQGVIENLRRKDLNPIELAKSAQTYMNVFGKNSNETGKLLGISPEHARGLVRLLDLPEDVQRSIRDGAMSLNAARRLLTMQRIAPEQVAQAARKIEQNVNPEAAIAETLASSENALEMWTKWQNQDEPRAGVDLWPLAMGPDEFPMEQLDILEARTASKALGVALEAEKRDLLNEILVSLEYNPESKEQLIAQGAPEAEIERLAILVNPPACTNCPFYARVDKTHYCAFKACHNRKKAAWARKVTQETSKTVEIPVYDPDVDGKELATVTVYSYETNKIDELKKSYGGDLRLAAKPGLSSWSSPVDKDHVQAVVVGESARKLKEAAQARKAEEAERHTNEESWEERNKRWEVMRARRAAVGAFLWKHATPAFASLLEGVAQVRLLELLHDEMRRGVDDELAEMPGPDAPKKARQSYFRRYIMNSILFGELPDDYAEQTTPVRYAAAHLVGLAKEWGVTLPAEWMNLADENEFMEA